MKIFHDETSLLALPAYGIEVPLTDGRALKTAKYLLHRGIQLSDLSQAPRLERSDLEAVHSKAYVDALFDDEVSLTRAVTQTFELVNPDGSFHRYHPTETSRPLSGLLQTCLLQTRGTMAALEASLIHGSAYYLGGGLHHAMSFGGRGFCLINDIVIAARWAQRQRGVGLIWVIDVDAHKGDGTAELTHGDSSIRSLSIHMKEGWPLDGPRVDPQGQLHPWFLPSDVDIELGAGEEGKYLASLQLGLNHLEEISAKVPDLAIVVQGADPFEGDALPSAKFLNLTKAQMLERDLLVYHFLRNRGIPQAYVMSGGYGERAHEIYCQFIESVPG